jgi:hypothetical protein
MTPDFQHIDKIDAYLNDVLSAGERAKFEQELAADPNLRREFDLVQDMLGGVELAGDEALKGQIGTAHAELATEGFFAKPEAKVVQLKAQWGMRRVLAVAASVLLLVAAGVWWWSKSQGDPAQEVAKQYLYAESTKLPTLLDDISAPGLGQDDRPRRTSLAAALKLYQNKSFGEAEKALTTHHQTYPKDTISQFYLALSHLELGHFDQAAALLRPITPETLTPDARSGQASQALDFQYEMTWYLALASSQLPGQAAQDSTLLLLRKLEASGNGEWAAKAREVVGKIEDTRK